MKLPAALVAGSLALNLALAALFAFRPSLAPLAFRDYFARQSSPVETATKNPAVPRTSRSSSAAKLWPALATEDLTTLASRLRAAGFPASIIRAILIQQVNERYEPRIRALQQPDPNIPYWKTSPYNTANDKHYLEANQLQRERSRLWRDLLKDDPATQEVNAGMRRQYGNLTRPQIDALQRIEDDYNEMSSTLRASMNNITLPEDVEKLALLAREKHADLAAILSPAEMDDYELRSSRLTSNLRSRLTTFDASESEFRALYAATKAVSDKFPGGYNGTDQQGRQSAEQEFNAELRASLGEARYADYVRESTPDYQQIVRLGEREHLPASTVADAYNLRDVVAQESNRIFDDASLNADQKRAALQLLAQNTRVQITAMLGPVAGPTYVKTAETWLANVERGGAVKFPTTPPFMIFSENNTYSFSNSPTYRRLPNPPPAR